MKEIKFSYIFQHEETGLMMDQQFTMEQIEGAKHSFTEQCRVIFNRWNMVARRQFTGLKDKNGKDIYEGDLLCSQIVHLRDDDDIKTVPCVVEWNDNKAGFYLVRGGYQMNLSHFLCGWVPTVFEVVGNIYENSNLVENPELGGN